MRASALHELLAPAVAEAERVAAFQELLNALPDDAARKNAIIAAVCVEQITHDDATLLIQAYDLGAA